MMYEPLGYGTRFRDQVKSFREAGRPDEWIAKTMRVKLSELPGRSEDDPPEEIQTRPKSLLTPEQFLQIGNTVARLAAEIWSIPTPMLAGPNVTGAVMDCRGAAIAAMLNVQPNMPLDALCRTVSRGRDSIMNLRARHEWRMTDTEYRRRWMHVVWTYEFGGYRDKITPGIEYGQ